MSINWMNILSLHYSITRMKSSKQELLLLFDLDGTIFDTRYMIVYALHTFDQLHHTDYFHGIDVADITMPETELAMLMQHRGLDDDEQRSVLDWYMEYAWNTDTIREAHSPYPKVFDVIRWFQAQPRTFVGINTARTEMWRDSTLRSLNRLGRRSGVTFSQDLVFTRDSTRWSSAEEAKVAGVRHFLSRGYCVFGMVDNEPANLAAIDRHFPGPEILLLHADTIFESCEDLIPPRTIRGREYDPDELTHRRVA
ncbi:MAG: HAD family hydrolase [Thermoleophilia bacterium]